MRFAKQRFVICVLFFALPVLYFFALIQSPYVSQTTLTWALKVARFRTGLKVDAQSWQVNVGSFSVSLGNFQLQEDSYVLRAPEVSFSFSPLGLLFGRLSMSRVDLVSPTLTGSLPPEMKSKLDSLFDSKNSADEPESQKQNLLELPNTIGKQVFNLSEGLSKKNLRFESLRIQNLKIILDQIQIKNGNLEIENYGDGQARFQAKLEELKVSNLGDTLNNLDFSVSLVRSTRTEFFFLFPKFNLEFGNSDNFFKVESNGRWPGLISLRTQGHLNAISQFVSPNAFLKSKLPEPFVGLIQGDLEFTNTKNNFDSIKGKFSGRGLRLSRYAPNDLDLEFSKTDNQFQISQFRLVLPGDPGDGRDWKKEVSSTNLAIDLSQSEQKISGELKFLEAGLCGILIAAGEQLCPVGLKITGSIPINGSLNPLKISGAPELNISDAVIEGNDIADFANLPAPLLRLHPLTLSGPIEVFSDHIDLKDIKLTWSEKSVLKVTGDIAYDPIVLKLLAKGETVEISEMLTEFLGLAPQGSGLLDADILYDERLNPKTGWTWVKGKLNLENVGVEKQNFGTLIGNVNFENLALIIGPLKLANGGGKAAINGKMNMDSQENYLRLRADLDRLEIRAGLENSKKDIFSGFVSGDLDFSGRLKKEQSDFFGGPIRFRMNNFSIFGIPFSKGTLFSRYQNGILFFDSMDAEARGTRVLASGLLHPEKGSRIDFSSEDFPISDLNLGMGLDEIKEGTLKAKGFWSRAEGWGVQGYTQNLRLGGKIFPQGNVQVRGAEDTLKIDYSIPRIISLQLENNDSSGPTQLKLSLNDLGIYGGFAFLKNWPSQRNVETSGSLDLSWTPQSGKVETNNFSISGPSGRESLLTNFLVVPGKNEISWKNGSLVKNTFHQQNISNQISLNGNPGDRSLNFSLRSELAFLDLFVPNFQFFEGQIRATGTIPLNPDISTLVAQGEMKNGIMQIRGLGLPIEQLNGNFSVASQIFNFTDAGGKMGTGEAKVSGGYRLSLEKPGASIRTTLNKAQVIVMDDVPAEITGEIKVTGEKIPYLLSGNVIITNSLYTKEFVAGNFTDSSRVKPVLNFNIDAELGPQNRVKNSLADVLLTGRMNLGGNDVTPEIKGRAKLVNGNFFANQNSFQVIQGTVDFPGGQPGTPLVNVQGNTIVKANNQDYRIELKVKGPGTDPALEFSSDPNLPTQDIVSLLAFGLVRSEQGGLDANADLAGAARVEAFQALFGKTLGKGLNKTTGFQVQFRAAPDQAQKEFIPKVMVSRKLTDKVTASFGNSLDFAKPERNFQVDYNLLKNVNVTGVWEQGIENEDSSVGVDLRFKFDVK